MIKDLTDSALYPSLKNKVVLISGGASGIGASIVEHFCYQQSKVIFLDVEDTEATKIVDYNSKNYNNKPVYIKCDLKNTNSLIKTIKEIGDNIGNISILVNNAAHDQRHEMSSVTSEYWDDRVNINIKHFFCCPNLFCNDEKKWRWNNSKSWKFFLDGGYRRNDLLYYCQICC